MRAGTAWLSSESAVGKAGPEGEPVQDEGKVAGCP